MDWWGPGVFISAPELSLSYSVWKTFVHKVLSQNNSKEMVSPSGLGPTGEKRKKKHPSTQIGGEKGECRHVEGSGTSRQSGHVLLSRHLHWSFQIPVNLCAETLSQPEWNTDSYEHRLPFVTSWETCWQSKSGKTCRFWPWIHLFYSPTKVSNYEING